jgi:class 3 adenylate cyclase/tetratricopeptide (TPR) repeat protein
MRCHACSTDNSVSNSFCESCGMRLGLTCRQCGYKNLPTARFCGACGVSLDSADGELKYATVMFADIVGSTELIAGLGPEQALERLHPALETMCAAVTRFDGTVVRTLGDGILALFGAPRAQEGHALLACEAALAMHAELPKGGNAPALRVGLHSGEVVSSFLVSDQSKIYGAHGLTIHLASRVQGMADVGGTCLTEDCYRLVRPYCDVRALGSRAAKGFPEAIEVYALLGLKPAVASQQFRGTNLTSFRGRAYELGVLQRAIQSIGAGRTEVIGISGAPGSGKSRLCFEFAEWCRSRMIPVLEARAQLYGHATPFQPVLEFLRLLFGISATDEAASSRRLIAERLLALATTFEADLHLLYDFLGISDDANPSSQHHAKARHVRLLDIIRHIVRQRGTATSVIIVEDLHWLDEASADFVTMLVDAVADTRTMLVLNFRPEYVAPWMKRSHYQELSLADLNPEDTSRMVRELVGRRPELDDLRQHIVERSGGNPFFVEELVRSLSENGAVFGEVGDYSLVTRIGERALPATVEAVIGARIDRLGEGEKTMLQIGAIIGKEFPLAVLKEVVGPRALNIDGILDALCEAELLQEQATIDGHQYAFRHPLIQEVAYRTQLKTRRSALHASVAQVMERFYRDRLNEFAGLIAYHFEAAGWLSEAASYEARAAKWVGSTNPAQAIRHWQKVRLLLQHQPRSPANDSQRIMANGQIAWLGWREGMAAEEAQIFLQEALGWARETDDTMIPMLLFVDGRITVASGGSADTYVDRVKEALSLLKEDSDAGRIATLNCALSQAYGWAGLLKHALRANDAAQHGLPRVDKLDHQFLGYNVDHWVMSLRGRILIRLGRLDEGEACLEAMLRIEQELLDPTLHFIPHLGHVDLAWCRGDGPSAEKHARRVSDIAEKTGIPYLKVYGFACMGTAKSIVNDLAGAERDFTEGLKFTRRAKASMGFEPEILASLADCYYRMDEPERAAAIAAEAISVARERSTRLAECRASITLGAALLAAHGSSRLAEAEKHFRHAENLIRKTGARIYEPLLARELDRIAAL